MSLDEYVASTRRNIITHGWVVQGIFDPDGERPWWYYTVGLTARGHPEFTLSGPEPRVGQPILNDLAGRVANEGRTYQDGDVVTDLVVGYNVALMRVARFKEFPLSMVEAIYPDRAVHALQLVLPDREGRYPWDSGYAMPVQEEMFSAR